MRFRGIVLVLFLALPVARSAEAGEYYRWVDEQGVVHLSQSPPAGGEVRGLQKLRPGPVRPSFEPEPGQRPVSWPEFPAEKPRETATRPPGLSKVELYTTRWCGFCRKAKAFFRKRGISYTEYDVEEDRAAARRKERLSPGGGVPVAVINGTVIRGFNARAYARALAKKP